MFQPAYERDYATLEKSLMRSPPGPIVPGIHSTPLHMHQHGNTIPRRTDSRANIVINKHGEPELVADLI